MGESIILKKPLTEKQREAIKKNLNSRNKYSYNRDVSFLKTLASGATDITDIIHQMRIVYRIPMTKSAVLLKLYKLRKQGIVESKKYKRKKTTTDIPGTYSLHALTSFGKKLLVSYGYPREHIRSSLPLQRNVSHEIYLREIVRAIKREAARVKNYRFSISDELDMKKLQKKRYYADLFITLSIDAGEVPMLRQLYIEFDNDTESVDYIIRKARYLVENNGKNVLIVCTTSERIESIVNRFKQEVKEEMERIPLNPRISIRDYWRQIQLVVFYDFQKNGFLQSNILKAGGKPADFIGEYKGKILINSIEVHN